MKKLFKSALQLVLSFIKFILVIIFTFAKMVEWFNDYVLDLTEGESIVCHDQKIPSFPNQSFISRSQESGRNFLGKRLFPESWLREC